MARFRPYCGRPVRSTPRGGPDGAFYCGVCDRALNVEEVRSAEPA